MVASFRNFRQSPTTHRLLDSSELVDFLGSPKGFTVLNLHQMGFNFFCYFMIFYVILISPESGLRLLAMVLSSPFLGCVETCRSRPHAARMFSLSLELLPKKPLRTCPRKAKRADFSRNMAWVRPASCRTSCLPLASLILYQCQCCIRLYGLIWSPTGSTDLELVKIDASFGCRPSGGPDLRCLQNLDSQFYWYIFGIYSLLICPIGSMYGIYANIWGILMVNVTMYGIHGSYGCVVCFSFVCC